MRKTWIALGVVAAAGIAWQQAGAEEAAPSAPPARVRVDVQMVSISLAEAATLVPAFRDRKTAEAAWTRVQAMIARDEAKLLDWPVLWLRNGGQGGTESVEEVCYPTEFEPPQGAGEFIPPRVIPYYKWGPVIPTAFETRNVGCRLEAAATVEQGGQVVSLDFTSEFVRLDGFWTWHTQRSPLGIIGVGEQPDFQTSKSTTQMRIHRGQTALVGVFVFADPEPHVELHLLHARATLLPPSAAILPTK